MSHKQDLAFFGLIFSLIVHFLLGVGVANMPSPKANMSGPTEIEFIDKNRPRIAVPVPDAPEEELDVYAKLKREADYLARLTQRVKKETVAREANVTNNTVSLERLRPDTKPQAERVAGRQQGERGDLPGGPMGDEKTVRGSALPPATLNQHIPGVQQGYFTILNADTFTYYAFFSRMNEQVRNRWTARVRAFVSNLSEQELTRLSTTNRTTRGELLLTKTGEFVSAKVHLSAGAAELDEATIEAFRTAAPFLNPPGELVESDGLIHLPYAFTIYFRPTFGPATN